MRLGTLGRARPPYGGGGTDECFPVHEADEYGAGVVGAGVVGTGVVSAVGDAELA